MSDEKVLLSFPWVVWPRDALVVPFSGQCAHSSVLINLERSDQFYSITFPISPIKSNLPYPRKGAFLATEDGWLKCSVL